MAKMINGKLDDDSKNDKLNSTVLNDPSNFLGIIHWKKLIWSLIYKLNRFNSIVKFNGGAATLMKFMLFHFNVFNLQKCFFFSIFFSLQRPVKLHLRNKWLKCIQVILSFLINWLVKNWKKTQAQPSFLNASVIALSSSNFGFVETPPIGPKWC